MKSKTKKTVAGWVVGTLFVGIMLAVAQMGMQVGITAFPMLIQVCTWLVSQVVNRVS